MENKYTRDQIKDAIWQELKESDYTGENNDRAYEILGIVLAGVDKIGGEAQTGSAWVKASGLKIEYGKNYYAQWLDGKLKATGWFQESDGTFFWNVPGYIPIGKHEYERLSILDESAPSVEISQDAHEKEVMMNAFNEVRRIFEGRVWIMEGRGPYPYNDDRYREEVRYMYDEFDKVLKDTWSNIQSKSVEYRKAIIAEYLKGTAAAGTTAWVRADVKRPAGWQLVRFHNSKKRFPVKFAPHVIADMAGKTYEPQELEYLSDEGAAAAGREEDFTEAEADFMRECNLYPTSNGVTILTENDEGASIDTDDIIKLAAILKRYVTTFKQNRNNENS